jgi:hypothetical protein
MLARLITDCSTVTPEADAEATPNTRGPPTANRIRGAQASGCP